MYYIAILSKLLKQTWMGRVCDRTHPRLYTSSWNTCDISHTLNMVWCVSPFACNSFIFNTVDNDNNKAISESLWVIRQKSESQNGGNKKTKHAEFSEKTNISYPLIRCGRVNAVMRKYDMYSTFSFVFICGVLRELVPFIQFKKR